jgi:hypothetical protein
MDPQVSGRTWKLVHFKDDIEHSSKVRHVSCASDSSPCLLEGDALPSMPAWRPLCHRGTPHRKTCPVCSAASGHGCAFISAAQTGPAPLLWPCTPTASTPSATPMNLLSRACMSSTESTLIEASALGESQAISEEEARMVCARCSPAVLPAGSLCPFHRHF